MTEIDVRNLANRNASVIAPQYGIDPAQLAKYLTAIAKLESNYDEKAKNKNSTARGLMQILICTQREIEKKRAKVPFAPASFNCKSFTGQPATVEPEKDIIYNAEYCMFLAAHELAYQYNRYKKKYPNGWQIACHAYNQGSFPGARKQDGAAYANTVLKNAGSLNEDYAYMELGAPRQEYY
jgi:hypothetical protein